MIGAEQSIDALLDSFAGVVIGVGVNVQPEQELIIAAPLEAAAFVRSLGSAAYMRGASLVTPVYDDPELLRTRLLHETAEALDSSDDWLANSIAQRLHQGAAYLSVLGPRPELLAGVPVERILHAHRAQARGDAVLNAVIASLQTNASSVPFITGAWARQIFPNSEPGKARRFFWSELIDAVTGSDIITAEQTAWDRLGALSKRRVLLQAHAFRALHFTGPKIRLSIGLADGHIWRGGRELSRRGVAFAPVLPAGAVFTATAPETTEGVIAFSRPIAIAGEHVEGLEVRFEAGAATRVIARSGQSAFERLLDSDAGARRLGKIAIVEATAPLANRHGSFKNPMLDGAAAPHVTFGATLPGTLTDPKTGNESAIHLDAMFDTAHLSVDGIDAHGTAHAILRDGIFAI